MRIKDILNSPKCSKIFSEIQEFVKLSLFDYNNAVERDSKREGFCFSDKDIFDFVWGTVNFSRSFFADSSYMLSFSVLCSCVCSRLISPSVSSWHKQDNTLMHQSPGHIQRRTPYNF